VLTIGNFDGVHLGHKALLARLRSRAQELGLPATVLCFEPHPREFFAPDNAPPRLCSVRRKLELLETAGVDRVCVQSFDAPFAALDAEEFVRKVLIDGLQVRHLMIGDDFRFGRGRQGDFGVLQAAGTKYGFGVEAMQTQEADGERVSSSAIREAFLAGNIEHATRLLGEPFVVSGRVHHGDEIGRTIGYPTANIGLGQATLPLSGIFAVSVDGGPLHQAMGAANVGVRPTIGDKLALRLEVFVLDYSGDLYGQRLRVRFHHKVRDEEKFDSLEALTTAIDEDCRKVRAFFQTMPVR
jgi:riboflavin kinase / FMN adenylyltransferase